MEPRDGVVPHAARGRTWRGVVLLVVLGMLLGVHPLVVLIGLTATAFVLDRVAPHKLGELLDLLSF